jgi:hypothetical protein
LPPAVAGELAGRRRAIANGRPAVVGRLADSFQTPGV